MNHKTKTMIYPFALVVVAFFAFGAVVFFVVLDFFAFVVVFLFTGFHAFFVTVFFLTAVVVCSMERKDCRLR